MEKIKSAVGRECDSRLSSASAKFTCTKTSSHSIWLSPKEGSRVFPKLRVFALQGLPKRQSGMAVGRVYMVWVD